MPALFPECAVIELKKASALDAIKIAETRRIVWKETYPGIYPEHMWENYDLQAYAIHDAKRITQPGENYYVFLDGDRCEGYFSFGPYHPGRYKDYPVCLNHLYIRKSHQGRGLGKLAFATIRKYCGEQGINKFFCGCNANNLPAMSFYRHMGGMEGDQPRQDVPKMDQIVHFEFYLGE